MTKKSCLPAHPQRLGAVVLAKTNFGEADLVVTFLTRERGLVSGLAKHARKSIRRFGGGLLAPAAAAWYDFRFRHGQELAFVDKAEANPRAPILPADPLILALTAWALELVKAFEAPDNPAEASFNLLLRHLGFLATNPGDHKARQASLLFTVQYMSLAGFKPDLSGCQVCGQTGGQDLVFWWDTKTGGLFCRQCLDRNGPGLSPRPLTAGLAMAMEAGGHNAPYQPQNHLARYPLGETDLKEAERFLMEYAAHQLGRPFKSPDVLRQLC